VPAGVPTESDSNRPETAIDIQVARRAAGAASPTPAYINGEMPAAAAPAATLAANSQLKPGATPVRRFAVAKPNKQEIRVRRRPIRSDIWPSNGALTK
jgi:hypothetical protein